PRALRRRGLGGVAQSCGNRRLTFRLDPAEQLVLRFSGKLSRLRQHLAVCAVRCLAMAESDKPEGEAITVGADCVAELRADGRELARAADLGVHALRRVEHNDCGGKISRRSLRRRVLGCDGSRSEESSGQEQEPKPRTAFPLHGVRPDQPAASCYTRFQCAKLGRNSFVNKADLGCVVRGYHRWKAW